MTNKVVQIENIIDNIKIKLTNRYIIILLDYKLNKYYLFSGSTEHFKNMDHVLGHMKNNNMYMIPVCSKLYSSSICVFFTLCYMEQKDYKSLKFKICPQHIFLKIGWTN